MADSLDQYQRLKLQQEIATLRAEVASLRRSSLYLEIPIVLANTAPATAGNYGVFFVSSFACEVIEAWASWTTAGSSTPTLTIEKLTSGQALDAGTQVIASTWAMNGTANDPTRIKGVANVANRSLNPGDRLALKDAGTLTAVAGLCVTVLLRIRNTNVSRVDNP